MSHKQKKRGKKHNTKATTADPRPQPGWPNQLSHPAQAGSTIQHSQQDQHALHLQMQQNQQFQQAQQAEQIHQQQQQAPQYHNMQPMPPNQSGPVPQNLQAQHHMLGPHNEQNPQLAHQNLQYPQMQNMPQNAQAMQNQLAQRNEQIRHQEQMQINQQYQQNQLNRQAENANMQVAHVNPEVQGGHLRPHGPHPYPGLPPQYPGRPSGHPNARPYTYNGSAHSVPPSFQPGNVQSPPVPSLAHPQYVQENADYFNNNPDVPHPPIGFSPYEGLADSPYVLSPRGPQSASAFLVGNTQSPMFQPTQSPYGYNVTSPAVNGQPQQLVHNQDHSGFPQPQNVGNPQFPHPGQFNCPPGQMAPPSHYRQSSNHPPNHHGHISRAPRMPRPTNYPNVPEAFQGMFENSNFLSRSSSQNPQAVRIVPRDRTQPNRPMPDYPAPTQNQMSQQYPQESVPNPGQYSSDFANPSYMGPPRMESGQPHQTRGKRNSTGPLDINEISGNHQPPSSLVNGNPAPSHYKSQPNSGNSCRNFQELQQSLLSGDEEMIVDSTPPTRSSSKNPPEKNKSNSGTLVDKSCVMESQQSSVSQPIQVALANNTTDPWAVEDASKGANHTESAKKTLEKGAVCAKIVDKLLEGKAESFKTAKKEAEKNMEVNNQLQISPEYVPFAGGIDDLLGSRPSSRDNSGEPTNCMNLDVSAVYDEVLEEPAPEEILSSPFPKTEPENKKQSDEKIISQIVAVNSQNVVSVSAEHVQDSQVDEQSHSVSHPTQKKGMIAKSSQSTGIAVNPDPQLDISRTRPLSHNPEHSVDGIDDQRGQADKIITSILKRKKEEDCLLVIKKQKSAGESAKVSHPQIDVAPGRIPPINVAPGSTTQINVAPGRIPPINVAPGSTPEINVAPGPNPPINVAPGSTPEINVAPGRIPPINVAPGPTPQINVAPGPNPPINVAPGRIPPINVAPDQNPQINVVPGPNPSINVAPGPSPSINVAPGRNPQINVAPGRIPRVKINVAPGPPSQINVVPERNPQINVDHGRDAQANVAPGRNPQINVDHGRDPQANVAPGRNPQINIAPGRCPRIKINVAPAPTSQINDAPVRTPQANVAHCRNPRVKATRKRAPVSKKKITRPKDSDDSSTDDTDDTRSSRSKRDSSHLSDHQDETKRVSHKKTAGPAPKRAANPPANALAGEENQAVQVEEEPRRHGLLLDPESEEIIEFVNNSRFKYLFEMTEEEFVKQFVNFPKKKRRHTRQMSVANYDFYMHIKEAKRPSFDKLIPLACTNLENKIGTEKEITEFILGHYIFSIPVLKVVQFIERDFRHLIFLTQLLPHTDLLGIRRYSYCGYGNVDTLSVKLPIQPESTPELVEKIKKFFKSLGYDTIIDDKIIFIRRTTKKLGSDKKGRRRHLSLYFEEEMLREALVEFKDCKTKGIKRLTLESAETILCSTGPDASYDHLIHEAIASRRSQRATEDQIAMYGLSHYNLDIPVKDVCDKISECLAKMSETGILSKTVSERGKVVYAEIPVEHVDTGRLVTSGDLKKTASEEHMNLARNTIKLLDPNGEGINSEDVANYIYEHNDFENVSQFEHILWRCLKKMERGGELSLTQTKEYQVNENKNETFVNTNVVVKWLK